MLCGKIRPKNKRGSVAVHLNVYDLSSMNGYAYWLGLGVFHSGVQVDEVEYAFGAHEYGTSGIFEGEPKVCEGFRFRKSILIGWTNSSEVRGVMEELGRTKYKGSAYNLISMNCNHFCNDACIRLTGNPIPNWVNRLARIGSLCHCIIPMNLNTTKVGHQDKVCGENKKKKTLRRSRRQRSSSSSDSSSWISSSSPALEATIGGSGAPTPLPLSSPLIPSSK